MPRLSEKLHFLRQQNKLSMQQLADKLQVSRTYIWEMEHGEKIPNIAMLIKICDVFQVSADWLIRDELE